MPRTAGTEAEAEVGVGARAAPTGWRGAERSPPGPGDDPDPGVALDPDAQVSQGREGADVEYIQALRKERCG